MSDLAFPAAWLRIDEAAVALGLKESQAYALAREDYWRKAVDATGAVVYAIEDVRATAKSMQIVPLVVPEPPKVDLRRGARPRWLFNLGRDQ